MLTVFPVVGGLSTEDPHRVGYVSETITLPCEHAVAKADLLSLFWTKDNVIIAQYAKGDNKPVHFHHSLEGRINDKVFPPYLTISNVALHDAGVYQLNIIPVKGDHTACRCTLEVNGRELLYLKSMSPCHVYLWTILIPNDLACVK